MYSCIRTYVCTGRGGEGGGGVLVIRSFVKTEKI